jgi:hypothetical protein
VDGCEEPFYKSLGFRKNVGHSVFCIDKRPYATGGACAGVSRSQVSISRRRRS